MDYHKENNVDYFRENIGSISPEEFDNWTCFAFELQEFFEIIFCCTSTNHIFITEKNNRTSVISPKDEERRSFYQSIKGLFPLVTSQDDIPIHEITTHIPNF